MSRNTRLNVRVGRRTFVKDNPGVLAIAGFFVFFGLYVLLILSFLAAVLYGLVVYGPDLVMALITFLQNAAV